MSLSNHLEFQANSFPQQTTPKIRPIFKTYVRWRCMQPSDITYINKYKPKTRLGITIYNLRSEKIQTSGIRNLRKAFMSSKVLSAVYFEDPEITIKQLAYLLDSTNHWRYLFFSSMGFSEELHQKSIKTFSRLGRCKKLTEYRPFPDFSTQHHVTRKIAARAFQQLKGLHKLENLDLGLPLFNATSTLNFRLPQSLKFLDLDFKNKDLIPQQQLSSFLASLQHCNLLEHLLLSFSREYQIELSDAHIWTSFFQKAPRLLTKLRIHMKFPIDQKPEGVRAFIRSLKYLESLTSLNIVFDGHFSLICNNLQSLTQLEALELEFSPSFSTLEIKEIHSFSSMLLCLQNLKILDINLPRLKSPEKSLMSIAEGLKRLSSLETLDLRTDSNFNEKSLQILFNNIAPLHLTRLNLDFGGYSSAQTPITSVMKQNLTKLICFWKKNNLIPFFSDIRSLTKLSNLTLQLSSFGFSNQESKQLSLALQKLNKLSSIDLSLPQFDSARDFEGLQRLSSCFKYLPKLAELDLRFEGNRISDREVEIVSSHLAGCRSLTYLNLEFRKAAHLKEKSLYSLLLEVRRLSKLKGLSLLFRREEAFGEKAVSDFLEGLMVLKDLMRFSFIYHPRSRYFNNKAPIPLNLEGYGNLRRLVSFIVGDSRYL